MDQENANQNYLRLCLIPIKHDSTCCKDSEEVDQSFAPGMSADLYSQYRNCCACPQQPRNRATTRSSYIALWILYKVLHSILQRYVLICIHCCNTLERAQMPINWLIDNENVVHLQNGVWFMFKNEITKFKGNG